MHRFAFPFAVCLALAATVAVPPARANAPQPELPRLIFGDEGIATADGAAGVYYNPALVGLRYPSEMLVSFSRYNAHSEVNDGFFAWRGTGFRVTRIKDVAQYYGLTQAFGSETMRFGWTVEMHKLGYSQLRVLDHRVGLLMRPAAWLSLGLQSNHFFEPELDGQRQARTYGIGLGLRPFALLPAKAFGLGTRFTLGADAIVADDGSWSQTRARWTARLEALSGVTLSGALDDHGGYHLGLALHAPAATLASHGAYTRANGPGLTTTALSLHTGEERTAIAPPGAGRVATIAIQGPLGDESLGGASLLGGSSAQRAVGPIHAQLERALADPLTRGVMLDLGGAANTAALEELRPRIAALRAAGKPVVAYIEDGGGRGDLYLASVCTRTFASEEALFWQLGLRSEHRYYRQFLAGFGLRLDRTSIGAFKSAYRNYSADSMPPADRESIEHTLDVAQKQFVNAVCADRRIEHSRLEPILDGREWPPADLVRAGVIDSVGYREQALAELGRLSKLGPHPREVRLSRVPEARRTWKVPAGVGIVYASGGIEEGESGSDLLEGPTLGATTLIRQLERAFATPSVRAVVFRIESPGGSTVASNLIHHALERLVRETGKLLVVSMGEVAASGGYYIAVPARRIFADRATYTGSIGVLFVKPSFEGFYAKHGVRQEEIDRGAFMRAGSANRDWDAAAQASADSAIARTYDRFVDKVAAGRHLPRENVLMNAQGRVWMGEDAMARGLVDEIGGLDAAVKYARALAGIPVHERIEPLEFRRPRPGFFARLFGGWLGATLGREAQLHDPAGIRLESDDPAAY